MKLHEFQQHLRRESISLAIFTHPDPAITYFTGMKPSYALFIVTPSKATLFLSALDKKPVFSGKFSGITVKSLSRSWHKKTMPARHSAGTVGIHKNFLTVSSLEQFKKRFPRAKFVDISPAADALREEKTPEEVQSIAKACALTSKAFAALLNELPKGALNTEQDVALFLEREIRRHGGGLAFPTIAAAGKNAAIPHHATSTMPLKKGFLVVDFGASYGHYCADMTRTVFLGTPTGRERRLYGLLLEAQLAAVAAVGKGVPFMELDRIARKKLGTYARHFIHSLGHGIGIEVHEGSQYRDRKGRIKKGHVFTIEPGIYLPGRLGMRIEDTVWFDGRAKSLTKATKELICIPWKN